MTRGPAPKDNPMRRNHHPHAQQLPAERQPGRELPKALGIKTTAVVDRSGRPMSSVWSLSRGGVKSSAILAFGHSRPLASRAVQ